MEKKKALIKAAAVKPKGNGIKERCVRGICVYAVVFWSALRYHRTIAADNFAFAFVHWFYKTLETLIEPSKTLNLKPLNFF